MTQSFYIRSPWFTAPVSDVLERAGWQRVGRGTPDCVRAKFATAESGIAPCCPPRGRRRSSSSCVDRSDFLPATAYLVDGKYRRSNVLSQDSRGARIRNRFQPASLAGLTDKAAMYTSFAGSRGLGRSALPGQHLLPPPHQVGQLRRALRSHLAQSPYLILKPTAGYGSKGIIVLNRSVPTQVEDAVAHIQSIPHYTKWVVQEYLWDPALFRGRKFHMRMYVLLHRTLNATVVYLYRTGWIYAARTPYGRAQDAMRHLDDRSRHITNISAGGQGFPFPDAIPDAAQARTMWARIAAAVRGLLCPALASGAVVPQCPRDMAQQGATCFDVLGLDLMFTRQYQPRLLEINAGVGFNLVDYDTAFERKWNAKFGQDVVRVGVLGERVSDWVRLCSMPLR